jgi:magnesium transporter
MTENTNNKYSREILEKVIADLDAGQTDDLTETLENIHPAEIANLLESLPPESRSALWETIPAVQEGDILSHMRDEARTTIIDEMDHSELLAAAESMNAEDLVEVLEELPDDLSESIMVALDQDHRERVENILSYDEGTAGRLMNTDVASVRKDVTLAVVLRWLRRHHSLPKHTDALIVISEKGQYLGMLPMEIVVTGDPSTVVETVMQYGAVPVQVNADELQVATLFERRDLTSIAVWPVKLKNSS